MAKRPFQLFLVAATSLLAVSCAQLYAVQEDPDVAKVRWQADHGDAEAQYQMGLRYANGQDVRQHYASARGWFELAAAQGHPGAQYMLGIAYSTGRGVPKDYRRALDSFAKAAEQGHVRAQYQLGDAYLNGRGTKKEPAWAALWLGKAAEGGHAEAQFALGVGYAAGMGLPVDRVEAWKWLRIAERDGHEQAPALRRKVESALDETEKKEAEKRFAEWRPYRSTEPVDDPTIRFVQYALFQLGYEPGPVDGKDGPATMAAVNRYGHASGLAPAKNVITADVIDRLRSDLAALPVDDLKADLGRK
jgi:TPR repeat protein